MATVCPFCGAHEISKKGACITWGCGSFLPRLGNVVGDPVQSINCNQIATLQKQNHVLREALTKIATMVKPGDIDDEMSDEIGEPTEVEDWTIDEAYSTGTSCIELARAALEATKEGE
jgi:hypothetical protein